MAQWQRGESGNPSGKPSAEKLKKRLEEVPPRHAGEVDKSDPLGRTRIEIIMDTLYATARDSKNISHVRAGEEYLSRAIGKSITPIDVTGTVTHESAEKHVENILQLLSAGKKPDGDKSRVN